MHSMDAMEEDMWKWMYFFISLPDGFGMPFEKTFHTIKSPLGWGSQNIIATLDKTSICLLKFKHFEIFNVDTFLGKKL